MKRLLLALTLILGGSAIGSMIYMVDTVEKKLSARGFQHSSPSIQFPAVTWMNLRGNGINAKKLSVHPAWPVKLRLFDVQIDPRATPPPPATEAATSLEVKRSESTGIPFEIQVQNLSLLWDEHQLMTNLEGSLFPEILLTNETSSIAATWDPSKPHHVHGNATTQVSFEHLSADVAVTFDLGEFLEINVSSSNVVLEHRFLSTEPTPSMKLKMRAVWKPDTHELAAEGTVGSIAWNTIGTTNLKEHDLQFRVPMTPLKSIVEVFGESIPESNRADIAGEIGLAAHIKGPPWDWSFEPAAQALTVSGALPANFGGDRIRWKRNDVPFETGPASPGWVRLDQAGWLPEAAIAAEDIRFRTHPGFDLIAIQEALDASMDEERMRGGSTITQQLAKNLFLDGRRTLLRKLRELVLALNMEERMSKDAILELYLNVVEFGPSINGIAEASDAWFMKDPAYLSAREAAFLVSILPAPNMWHQRIRETNRVPIKRVNEVLNRMRIRGAIGKSQHRQAIQERLRVVPP